MPQPSSQRPQLMSVSVWAPGAAPSTAEHASKLAQLALLMQAWWRALACSSSRSSAAQGRGSSSALPSALGGLRPPCTPRHDRIFNKVFGPPVRSCMLPSQCRRPQQHAPNAAHPKFKAPGKASTGQRAHAAAPSLAIPPGPHRSDALWQGPTAGAPAGRASARRRGW